MGTSYCEVKTSGPAEAERVFLRAAV
jgi:hypothetical protein